MNHHTPRTGTAILAALLFMVSAVGAAAAATTTEPGPRQLWDAYPLKPGQADPGVRLPPDSATPRPTPARVVTTTTTAPGGGGVPVALLVGVGVATLVLGAVAGRHLRKPSVALSEVCGPQAPTRAPAMASPASPRVPPPRGRSSAPTRSVAPQRSVPPQRRVASETRSGAPPAARDTPPPPAPPAGPPVPQVPSGRRFCRDPWPTGSEALWRCEITRHFGIVHADFRAMALQPGRRRAVEVARTSAHARPGWGIEPPEEELVDTIQELSRALRGAGWRTVDQRRNRLDSRFVWPGPGAPALDLSDHLTTPTGHSDEHRADA